MDCCHCEGIETLFDNREAKKKLERYRKRGAEKTTRLLVDALRHEGVEGMTLLDIGGGIGAVQFELFEAGVSSAVDVDASRAYVAAAREEAQRQGVADKVRYYHGDFVRLAPDILRADIVTLDRVICCYPDMRALVDLSAEKAAHFYAVVYPRDTWWVKAFVGLGNLYFRLRRIPFRAFVHPTQEVETLLSRKGFFRRHRQNAGEWQVALYGRGAEAR